MGLADEPEPFETVIIGGGQAGLAVGYELARRGRRFVILDERQQTGDSWRSRWDSLSLITPARFSALPGMRFPGPASGHPTMDEVADYVEMYARHFALPVRHGIHVDRLSRADGSFVIESGNATFGAENVVVATGAFQTPNIPPFASELAPDIVQLHSSDYRRPSALPTGDALVVGAGNSGAEIAYEVAPLWFFANHVLTTGTPIGRRMRSKLLSAGAPLESVKSKDLAAAGVERVPRTVGASGGMPMLADGHVLCGLDGDLVHGPR